MAAHVLLDGSVYSPADPFATALVVDGDQVAWVGQNAGARSILDDSMTSTALAGQLVTPSFALGALGVAGQDVAALQQRLCQLGYGTAHLFLSELPQHQLPSSALEVRYYVAYSSLEALEGARTQLDGRLTGVYLLDSAHLSEELTSYLAQERLGLSLVPADDAATNAALELLGQLEPLTRVRLSPRLDGLTAISEENLRAAIDLQVSLGFSADFAVSGAAYGRALAAGASVVLGSDPLDGQPAHLGWELVSAAVNAPAEMAVSARAAFQSMTRAVFRARGEQNPFAGQLVPGAPAHYAVWEVTELMVQTPDSRISAWSTDPRARTPLLPVLSIDVPRPQLRALAHAGEIIS